MPVTFGRTRKQLRQSIGLTLGAINQDDGTIESSPSGTGSSADEIVDSALQFGGTDEHRGKWVVATDSNSSVYIRRVASFTTDTAAGSSYTLRVTVDFPRVTDTGWTYELWDEDMPPTLVHEFIDQAFTEITRKGSVSFTSDSIHTGGNVTSFSLDSAWTGLQEVEWRNRYTGEQIASLDTAPSTANPNVSISTDTEDYREGSGSAEFTIGAGVGSSVAYGTSSFSAIDMRGYTHVEGWIKSNAAITSSHSVIKLFQGSSAKETLPLPALNADSWTWFSVALANPEIDSGITSLRFFTGSSGGSSEVLHFDDITAHRDGAEKYRKLARKFWSVDKANRKLVIQQDAHVPYAKLQITGVRKPNLLTTDSAVSEIPANFVINSATAKALRARGDRRGNNRDASYEQADRYEQLAQVQRTRMGSPNNLRWLDD